MGCGLRGGEVWRERGREGEREREGEQAVVGVCRCWDSARASGCGGACEMENEGGLFFFLFFFSRPRLLGSNPFLPSTDRHRIRTMLPFARYTSRQRLNVSNNDDGSSATDISSHVSRQTLSKTPF